MSKPSVLVLGGLGFIGRNLVQFLHDNGLTSKLGVADKQIPELASLSKKQLELMKSDAVVFKQANVSKEVKVDEVFALGPWDYVINLAGETKYSQTEAVYKENIIDVSVTCAKVAAKHEVKRYIEVSSSQMYDTKDPATETERTHPWTKIAEAKLKVEEELKKIPNLSFIVVRPAVVYGPGDTTGITPRLICGAIYKNLGETMEFLWDKDLKLNTIHIRDVVGALWHLCNHGNVGEVYNLADEGHTTQSTVGYLLEEIFGIKTSYMGYMASKAATTIAAMKTVADLVNEKHLTPWSELCKTNGIAATPLTPYLDEELLYHNHISLDGSKIKSTGFDYAVPKMTKENLKETLDYFVAQGWFPANYTVM